MPVPAQSCYPQARSATAHRLTGACGAAHYGLSHAEMCFSLSEGNGLPSTCSDWVLRLEMLFHTRKTRLNAPGTVVLAMSPMTTGRSTSLIFALNRETIGPDR